LKGVVLKAFRLLHSSANAIVVLLFGSHSHHINWRFGGPCTTQKGQDANEQKPADECDLNFEAYGKTGCAHAKFLHSSAWIDSQQPIQNQPVRESCNHWTSDGQLGGFQPLVTVLS
jgi:hypothetical protein